MIGRLALIVLVVDELERSARFYSGLLGMSVRYASASSVELDAGNIGLALVAAESGIDVAPTKGCSFAFYVSDAEAAVATLKTAGTRVIQEPHQEALGAVVAVVSDPDGYRIQLIELMDDPNR